MIFRSVNEVICHGIPDKRELKEGDIINLGEKKSSTPGFRTLKIWGRCIGLQRWYVVPATDSLPFAKLHIGLHADLNETYPVGKVDEGSQKLMRVTRNCLDEAIKICKPGALIRDIGKIMCVRITCVLATSLTLNSLENLLPALVDFRQWNHTRGMESTTCSMVPQISHTLLKTRPLERWNLGWWAAHHCTLSLTWPLYSGLYNRASE